MQPRIPLRFVVLTSATLCFGLACAGRPLLPQDASRATPPIEREALADEVPVRILEERTGFILDEQGGWRESNLLRYRVLHHTGVETWSSVSTYWHPWYMARPTLEVSVLDPAGAKHLLDPSTIGVSPVYPDVPDLYSDARMLRAPLPAVAVGSVVEKKTLLQTTRPFFVGGSVHSVMVQSSIPRDVVVVTVDVPESSPFKYELRDAKVQVAETRQRGRRKVVFTGHQMGAIKAPEPLMPSDVPRWPHVAFGTAESWNQVARAYDRAVAQRLNSDALAETARKLVSDGDSGAVKAEKLLTWLRGRVRYAGVEFGLSSILPAAPADTIKRAYGDCKDQAAVLVSMLRAVGIDAKIALLRTGPGEDVRPALPGLNVFDHAIVVIPGDQPLWLDPTSPYASLGQLPVQDQDRLALVIEDDVQGLTRIPFATAEQNTYTEVRTVHLSDYGKARVVEISRPRGAIEVGMRSSFDALKDETRKSLERYAESTYGSKKLAAFDQIPNHLIIAAATASGGVVAGMAEADRVELQGEERSQALSSAAEFLFRMRRYAEAGILMATASQGAENAAQYATRARMFQKVKPLDVRAMPSKTPEEVALKAVAVFAAVENVDSALRSELMSPRTSYSKDEIRVENELRSVGDSLAHDVRTPFAVLADLYVSTLTATKEGNDQVGYRVHVTSSGTRRKTYTTTLYLVKERNGFRVRACGSVAAELGEEVLNALARRDTAMAEQWLDWAEDLMGAGSGTDALRAASVTDLWQGKKDPAVAAASLCSYGLCAQQAVRVLTNALAKEKSSMRRGAILKALVYAYANLEQHEKRLDAALQLRKAFPESGRARALHLDALWALERYQDYRDAANERMKKHPDHVGLHASVGNAEARLGHFDAAIAAYEKLIDTGRASSSNYNMRAWIALFRGNVSDEDLGHALRSAQQTSFSNPNVLHTLASVYAELGKFNEAMQTLKKLLQHRSNGEPDTADWYVFGRIAEAYGLPDAALAAYRRVEKPKRPYRVATYVLAQQRLRHMKR